MPVHAPPRPGDARARGPAARRAAGVEGGRAATAAVLSLLLAALVGVYLHALSRAASAPAGAPPPPTNASPTEAPSPAPSEPQLIALHDEIARLQREGETAAKELRHDEAIGRFTAAEALIQTLPAGPGRDASLTSVAAAITRVNLEREAARRRERENQFEKRFGEFEREAGETQFESWERGAALGEGLLQDFPEKEAKIGPPLASLRKKLRDVDQVIQERLRQSREAAQAGLLGKAFDELRQARAWRLKDPRLAEASAACRALLAARDLVRVPAGPFPAGSDDPLDRNPKRVAETGEYLIDRFEVTCEQYGWFCDDTGHPPPPDWSREKHPAALAGHPVTGVTWADAEAFARWLGKRLPTDEEWEKAARGTDGRTYPWGDAFPERPPCNAAEPPSAAKEGWTAPATMTVGAIAAGNGFYGASDMAGNVWEWTSGRAPLDDDPSVEGRVLRGGSFACRRDALRCARRYVERPEVRLKDAGFRCVKSP